MKPAIEVSNISKRYRLNYRLRTTLRETVDRQMLRLASLFSASARERSAALSASNSSHETFWALKNVSLEVPKGQVLGIIGQNGSGKSTLMKLLSRVTAPTEGSIALRGRTASLLEVGTGFHPELSGRENIYLNGAILGMARSETRKKFDAIVEFSGVQRFIDMPVKRYSSGMYVRLAFSVAAHLESKILLVDEVLAVGDMDFQRKCLNKITEIAGDGRTIVMVSHSLRQIGDLCSRAIHIDKGQIIDDGDSSAVIDKYIKVVRKRNPEDFSELKHLAHSPDFVIRKVVLKNSAGRETRELLFKEPFSVEIEVRVVRRTPGVRIAAGFSNLADVWIGRSHYPNRDGETLDMQPGTYVLTWKFTSAFRPGSYYAGIGAHRQEKLDAIETLDHIPQALLFQVSSAPFGKNPEPFIHDTGLIALEAAAELKKTES